MNVEAGLQVGDLGGIVRRRSKAVLGVALGVSLVAYWIAMALPNQYESYATVLVEPQAVDPDLVEAGIEQTDLNRRLHLMAAQILSRPRLSRMIDEFGLYEDESHYMVRDEIISLMRDHVRVEAVVPELEQDQPVQRARREYSIDQFRIAFMDDDPLVARDVSQRLANDFIQEHIASRVKVSQKSVEFVEAELERLAQEIGRTEGRIATLKAENSGRLPEDMVANQRLLERVAADLAMARREIGSARSDEAFFRSQSATARDLLMGGERADTPHGRIRILELALADYEARGFTAKHPDVRKAQAELATLGAQIERESSEEGGPGSFAEHSATAEAERATRRRLEAEQEIARLEQRGIEVQTLLAQAPQVAEQLDAIEREYQHLSSSYQDFSDRRLEAAVQADLERRQLGEQFRVLEAAFLAPEPSSPNRILIVGIGIVFGLALGAGVGIVLEASDASVHDARQLQTSLNLPVLASIPEILLESDRLRQRRRGMRTAAATLGVVFFALIGGAANYWWVNGLGDPEESFEPALEAEAKAPAAGAEAGG